MKAWALLLIGVSLAGCADTASAPPAMNWTGGDAAHLASDEAACQRDAETIDYNQANSYSDGRYGPSSAMAAAINRDSPLIDQKKAVRRAAYAACMTDKGWKLQ